MKHEVDILRDVSERLRTLQIPFMLTGSMAMNFYAAPRMTRHIDLVVELKPEDAPRLAAALEGEYYVSRESVQAAVRQATQFNLIHLESVIKVDCIVPKESVHARAEFARRRAVTIGDIQTTIASKEDLILAKLAWAKGSQSETQLREVRNLLTTGCDREYLKAWAQRLDLRELLETCQRG